MITAIVSISVQPDRIPEVAQTIVDIAGVQHVYSVTGDVDLICVVTVREHEQLKDVVADRISKVEGVIDTSTNIAFKTYSSKDLGAGFDLGLD